MPAIISEFGIKLLHRPLNPVKRIHFILFSLALFALQAFGADWQTDYAELLKTYVTPDGVRYAAWHQNSQDLKKLETVVEGIAREDISKMTQKEQLAFYLNAYNAWILDRILLKYPTAGPLSGNPLFFFTSKITVAGKGVTFDRLEQKVIRPQFKEPRVHFALNCASKSCPPLSNHPFIGAELDQQLDEAARLFCNSDRAVRLSSDGRSGEFSKIFDWYQKDFEAGGGVISFMNRYRKTPLSTDLVIRFMNYDWSLNESQ